MELIADDISQSGNMESLTLDHSQERLACRSKAMSGKAK